MTLLNHIKSGLKKLATGETHRGYSLYEGGESPFQGMNAQEEREFLSLCHRSGLAGGLVPGHKADTLLHTLYKTNGLS